MPKRPILTVRPTVTPKPEFIAYLDMLIAMHEAEQGHFVDVTHMSAAEFLAFLTNGRSTIWEDDLANDRLVKLTGLPQEDLRHELWELPNGKGSE